MDFIRELPSKIIDMGLGPIPSEFKIEKETPKIIKKQTKKTRIFTGMISQGTFGEIIPFTPRETDLISSADDLKSAAENNLALFIAALPGRMIYEIKSVARIVLKDGTIRTGATQTINIGKNTDGSIKTKTITSRFAIANIYVFTGKNKRNLIDTVVLGPIDIGKFNPQQNSLDILALDLKTNLSITSIPKILAIQTPKPITPAPIVPAQITPPPAIVPAQITPPAPTPNFKIEIQEPRKQANENINQFAARFGATGAEVRALMSNPAFADERDFLINSFNLKVPVRVAQQTPAPATPQNPIILKGWNFNAQTLYEWFNSVGEALPTVDARGRLYEILGLGIANLYTGTAEQNIKLLNELKRMESHIV